jgi:flagellum-specific peptidoglycan hydrolase FlgJ
MTPSDFISAIAPAAVSDMVNAPDGLYVLASVTIAQAICESDWGRSAPHNNLFGIKSQSGQCSADSTTREFINGRWITVIAGFCAYDDWNGSITDHSAFLRRNGRYHALLACDDYVCVTGILHSAGYATDPEYANTLNSIIRDHDLTKYDSEAFQTMETIKTLSDRLAAVESALAKTPAPAWFTAEFGSDEISTYLKDATGDADFWRNFAVMLRVLAAKKL